METSNDGGSFLTDQNHQLMLLLIGSVIVGGLFMLFKGSGSANTNTTVYNGPTPQTAATIVAANAAANQTAANESVSLATISANYQTNYDNQKAALEKARIDGVNNNVLAQLQASANQAMAQLQDNYNLQYSSQAQANALQMETVSGNFATQQAKLASDAQIAAINAQQQVQDYQISSQVHIADQQAHQQQQSGLWGGILGLASKFFNPMSSQSNSGNLDTSQFDTGSNLSSGALSLPQISLPSFQWLPNPQIQQDPVFLQNNYAQNGGYA